MTKTTCIRIDEKYVKHLKRLSHILSLKRKEDLNYNDLIREAIEEKYPLEEKGKEE